MGVGSPGSAVGFTTQREPKITTNALALHSVLPPFLTGQFVAFHYDAISEIEDLRFRVRPRASVARIGTREYLSRVTFDWQLFSEFPKESYAPFRGPLLNSPQAKLPGKPPAH